jgi:hypothetical protein
MYLRMRRATVRGEKLYSYIGFIISTSEITILFLVPIHILHSRLAFIIKLIQPRQGRQVLRVIECFEQHLETIFLVRLQYLA